MAHVESQLAKRLRQQVSSFYDASDTLDAKKANQKPLIEFYGRDFVKAFIKYATQSEHWIIDPEPQPLAYIGKHPQAHWVEGNDLTRTGVVELSQMAGKSLHPVFAFYRRSNDDKRVIEVWHVDSLDYTRGRNDPLEYYTITFTAHDDAGTSFIRLPRLNYQGFTDQSTISTDHLIRFYNDISQLMMELAREFLDLNPDVAKRCQESARPGFLYKGLVNTYLHRSPSLQVERWHFGFRAA